MSKPLDELREEINSHGPYEAADQPDWETIRSVLKAIDAFEAEHPGLVDFTFRCQRCGAVEAPSPAGVSLVDIEASVALAGLICPDCAAKSKGKTP